MGIIDNHMSDRDKVKAVHDWIINNTVYDYHNYLNGTIPDASYEIQGVMLNGTAVCSGYAKAFDYFMYVLKIEHQYLTGVAYNGEESGGHAWNRVMIDGNWLYIDCTWDDPVGGTNNYLLYDYYLISYEAMSRDHAVEKAYSLWGSCFYESQYIRLMDDYELYCAGEIPNSKSGTPWLVKDLGYVQPFCEENELSQWKSTNRFVAENGIRAEMQFEVQTGYETRYRIKCFIVY